MKTEYHYNVYESEESWKNDFHVLGILSYNQKLIDRGGIPNLNIYSSHQSEDNCTSILFQYYLDQFLIIELNLTTEINKRQRIETQGIESIAGDIQRNPRFYILSLAQQRRTLDWVFRANSKIERCYELNL